MNILVVFAHPRFDASVVQRKLLGAIAGLEGITIRDLYQIYPDFAVDIAAEQSFMLANDVIILQHPFYWYSVPAIVKEWLDLVLEFNWAYGPKGTALRGKFLMSAISTGGEASAYQPSGRNRFPLDQLLAPLNQTAHLCGMGWLEPFVVYSGRHLTAAALEDHIRAYREKLVGLRDGTLDPLETLARGYQMPREALSG